MFEFNANVIPCGVLMENGDPSTIYCNTDTGECFFLDSMMSDGRLISEVSVDTPLEIEPEEIITAMEGAVYGECIGVIYDGDTIIKLLSDSVAIHVPMDDPTNSESATFPIDIYSDYDTVADEED